MTHDVIYLGHIADAINAIERYLEGISYEKFFDDQKTLDAVVRELEIVGEAANHLSQEFRNAHPDIPFMEMIGMRNKIIHEYIGVNTKIVWDTCKANLPSLKGMITSILKNVERQ